MSNYIINGQTLTDIADSIRAKTGSNQALYPSEMSSAIDDIQAGGEQADISFNADRTQVVFKDGLTEIPNYCCANAPITSVIIPDSVISLSDTSFQGCLNIENISIGANLNTPNLCYSPNGNDAPINITISNQNNNYTKFANGNIMYNNGFGKYEIDYANELYYCNRVTQLPNDCEYIPAFVAYKCEERKQMDYYQITLPHNVKFIGQQAFSNLHRLKSVVFTSDSIVGCDWGIFWDCNDLTDIYVPWSQGDKDEIEQKFDSSATIHYNSNVHTITFNSSDCTSDAPASFFDDDLPLTIHLTAPQGKAIDETSVSVDGAQWSYDDSTNTLTITSVSGDVTIECSSTDISATLSLVTSNCSATASKSADISYSDFISINVTPDTNYYNALIPQVAGAELIQYDRHLGTIVISKPTSNTITVTLNATEDYDYDTSIVQIDVWENNGAVSGLELNGWDEYPVTVDWGDGSTEDYSGPGYMSHNYSAPGVYTITYSGKGNIYYPTWDTPQYKFKYMYIPSCVGTLYSNVYIDIDTLIVEGSTYLSYISRNAIVGNVAIMSSSPNLSYAFSDCNVHGIISILANSVGRDVSQDIEGVILHQGAYIKYLDRDYYGVLFNKITPTDSRISCSIVTSLPFDINQVQPEGYQFQEYEVSYGDADITYDDGVYTIEDISETIIITENYDYQYYTFNVTGDNVDSYIASTEPIRYLGSEETVQIIPDIGYIIENITVSNLQGYMYEINYDTITFHSYAYTIDHADHIDIVVSALEDTDRDVTINVSNGSYDTYGRTTMRYDDYFDINIEPDSGYYLPSSISVSGASYNYDRGTGSITLYHAIDDVEVNVECIDHEIILSSGTVVTDSDSQNIYLKINTLSDNSIIDWGDGNTENLQQNTSDYGDDCNELNHTYDTAGTYTITVNGDACPVAGGSNITNIIDWTIGEEVTHLCWAAFNEFDDIQNITIYGDNIRAVGGYHFGNCQYLETLTFMNLVGDGFDNTATFAFDDMDQPIDMYFHGSEEDFANVVVDYLPDNVTVHYNWSPEPPITDEYDYLCFTAQQNDCDISINKNGSPTYTELQTSYDKETWDDFDPENDTIHLHEGEKVYFRGIDFYSSSLSSYWNFNINDDDALVGCSGNIMTLIGYGDNYTNDIPSDYCFKLLFSSCSALSSAPRLPATTIRRYCYYWMFDGCKSLVNAPELPATKLADFCYQGMFNECTSLENAPELPATTLRRSCYDSMFYGCTSLVTAPELPATSLVRNCYQYMFTDCTILNYIKVSFTAWSSNTDNSTSQWLDNVLQIGTFVCPESLTQTRGNSNIPEDWEIETF